MGVQRINQEGYVWRRAFVLHFHVRRFSAQSDTRRRDGAGPPHVLAFMETRLRNGAYSQVLTANTVRNKS